LTASNQEDFEPAISPDVGDGLAVWSNGGDTVLLQDPRGNVVDRHLYRGDY